MAVKIQKRHGTAAQWTTANPVLLIAEEGFETDTRKSKVGDGVTPWVGLPYEITPGPPLPPGGTIGQALFKNSSTNGDASWDRVLKDENGNIILSYQGNFLGTAIDIEKTFNPTNPVTPPANYQAFGTNSGITIDPLQDSQEFNYSSFNAQVNVDPNNRGFNFGNNFADAGATGYNAYIHHNATKKVGYLKGFSYGINVGDNVLTGGHLNNYTGFSGNIYVNQGYSIDYAAGLTIFDLFDTGSTLLDYFGITIAPTIRSATARTFCGVNVTPELHAAQSAGGMNLLNLAANFYGSNGYVSELQVGSNYRSGSNYGYIEQANLSPSIDAGAHGLGWTVLNISPNASTANSSQGFTYINGINIDTGNITTNLRKLAISINDGAINAFSNFKVTQPGFVDIGNNMGGIFTVASGSPVTTTDYLTHNQVMLALIQDNMTLGPLGIGLVNEAAVGQVSVSAGKQLDMMSGFVSGYLCTTQPGDGGTLDEYYGLRSFGIVNGGGAITVNKLRHFGVKDAGIGPSVGTVQHGLWIEPNIDNWLKKSLVIGAASEVVSFAGVALEITDKKAMKFTTMTSAERDALFPTPSAGLLIANSDTGTLEYHNGAGWQGL